MPPWPQWLALHPAPELVPPVLTQSGAWKFRKNATSAWVSQTAFEADATERLAASFCLPHPGRCFRKADGSKDSPVHRVNAEWAPGDDIPRIVAPLRRFGRPSTAAHKAGVEVLGGFWAASGEWSRHRFQKLFTTASGFRLHEKRAPRRDEKSSRFPRTFASYKVRIDNPPRSTWNFTSFTSLTRKVKMDP